jgi:hypothetical protein
MEKGKGMPGIPFLVAGRPGAQCSWVMNPPILEETTRKLCRVGDHFVRGVEEAGLASTVAAA